MSATAQPQVRPYRHYVYPPHVVLTEDAARTVSEELATLEPARAMIVCSARMARSVLEQNVSSSLGGISLSRNLATTELPNPVRSREMRS